MAAGQGSTQFLEISDFSSGIYNHVAPLAPVGAAQVDTMGCWGPPEGGLHPLPAPVLTATREAEDFLVHTGDVEDIIEFLSNIVTLDLIVVDNVVKSGGESTSLGLYDSPEQVFVAGGAIVEAELPPGPGPPSGIVRAYWFDTVQIFSSITARFLDITFGNWLAQAPFGGGGDLHVSRQKMLIGSLDKHGIATSGFSASFDSFRPVVTGGRRFPVGSGAFDSWEIWPVEDGTQEWQTVAFAQDGPLVPYFVAVHQNRTLVLSLFPRLSSGAGDIAGVRFGTGGVMETGLLVYISNITSSGLLEPYVTERDLLQLTILGGGAGLASFNANTLFIMGVLNTGQIVEGDIERPTRITDIPGAPGSFWALARGVNTPLGYVYGTRQGIWAFNGTEFRHLSPQLDGYFWSAKVTPGVLGLPKDEDEFFDGTSYQGRMDYQHPFIYCPGRFIMDVRTGGWFRLTKPTPLFAPTIKELMFFQMTSRGSLYAVPRVYDNSDFPPFPPEFEFWWQYSWGGTFSDYTWHSQPLPVSSGRRISVREVVLTWRGTSGTVEVDIIGTTTDTISFTANTNGIFKTARREVSLIGDNIELKIRTLSSNGETIVGRIVVGYQEERSI